MSSAASTDAHNGAHGLEPGLERFRAVRRELEAAVHETVNSQCDSLSRVAEECSDVPRTCASATG